jgi:hypothetical protein
MPFGATARAFIDALGDVVVLKAPSVRAKQGRVG